MDRVYAAIDLKSFYASVECIARGYDPFKINLVVADPTRTDKTICLAVSPALKSFGVPGRARLFEARQTVSVINRERLSKAPGRVFTGKSSNIDELSRNPSLELDFEVAPPRMAHYIEVSSKIYSIYLKYVSAEDMHVYSIDEVFIDLTPYLATYKMTARELVMTIIHDVLGETGITATAGIGTNLFLAKVAMDIVAKHIPADKDGVRIAELDEMKFRTELWNHKPLTDFWRIGRGISKKLEQNGMFTLGDVALKSTYNENKLYSLFGINAELIIDHAWGWEPVTIKDIKSYRPMNTSISNGQVLSVGYEKDKALIVLKEMTDKLVLDMVSKGLVTDQIVVTIVYDALNQGTSGDYNGEVGLDYYGRPTPKPLHGSINLPGFISSTKTIMDLVTKYFVDNANPKLLVRRIYVVANHTMPESYATKDDTLQLNLFEDGEDTVRSAEAKEREYKREHNLQKSVIKIKNKYGKNSLLKGMNYQDGATAKERNAQIGGHKA